MNDHLQDERPDDVRRQLRELIDATAPVSMDDLASVPVPAAADHRWSDRRRQVLVAACVAVLLVVAGTVAVVRARVRDIESHVILDQGPTPGTASPGTIPATTALPPGASPFTAIPKDGMVLDVAATPDTIYLGVQDVGDDQVFEHRLLEVDPTTGAIRRSTTIGLTPGPPFSIAVVDGVVWLGSDDGSNAYLSRFDDGAVTIVATLPGDPLLAGSQGFLWLAAQGGVEKRDPHTGELIKAFPPLAAGFDFGPIADGGDTLYKAFSGFGPVEKITGDTQVEFSDTAGANDRTTTIGATRTHVIVGGLQSFLVLDVPNGNVKKSISVGSAPRAVATFGDTIWLVGASTAVALTGPDLHEGPRIDLGMSADSAATTADGRLIVCGNACVQVPPPP